MVGGERGVVGFGVGVDCSDVFFVDFVFVLIEVDIDKELAHLGVIF